MTTGNSGKGVPPPHPLLYLLPKIYKPGIPSNHIVSSYSSPNERVSVYMNVHLQPYANPSSPMPMYEAFPRHDPIPPTLFRPDTIMATVDVTSSLPQSQNRIYQ